MTERKYWRSWYYNAESDDNDDASGAGLTSHL